MRYKIAIAFLAIVFVTTILLRFEKVRVGPYTHAEKDDLGITEAYFDGNNSTLFLIREASWASLNLDKIVDVNRQYKYKITPTKGNFLHFRDFKPGRPPDQDLKHLTPVTIATEQFASFNYKHDGKARSGHVPPINLPNGSLAALYRSSAEVAANNRDWFKSFIFYTDTPWQDTRHGVQFFYHPDFRITAVLNPPLLWLFLAPSFIALFIGTFAAISRIRLWAVMSALIAALLLHGVSFYIFLSLVRYGEAWGGGGRDHNYPYIFLAGGVVVAFALLVLHLILRRTASNKALHRTAHKVRRR